MKNLIITAVILALLLPLISSTAIAQDAPQSQIIWVSQANVIPAKAQAYEMLFEEWHKLLQKNKYSTPITVFTGSNATYGFLETFPDFAAMGKVFSEYQAIVQQKAFQELVQRSIGYTNGENVWLLMSRPDLSYTPENPRLKPGEAQFAHYYFFYIRPDAQAQMDAVLKKFVELFKKHKIGMGFGSLVAITGVNLPFYVVGSGAKSISDYWTESEKNVAIFGEEWVALVEELTSILRSVDQLDVTPRPDLSYTIEQ